MEAGVVCVYRSIYLCIELRICLGLLAKCKDVLDPDFFGADAWSSEPCTPFGTLFSPEAWFFGHGQGSWGLLGLGV